MAKQNRNTLKGYFETGKKPTEGQYANLIDSYVLLDGENTGSLNIKGDATLTGDITLTEVTASGIISSSTNIIADQFIGDGRLITGITSSLINISAQTASLNSGSLLISGTLFHSSASSTIRLGIETTGSIIPEGNGTFDLGSPTNYFKDTFVSRSHAINVTTSDLEASNVITSYITASQSVEVAGHISASNIISSGHITASGDISASGNIYSKGLLSSDGNSTFGNDPTDTHLFTGNITASHDISSSGEFIGASANITNITASIVSASGVISASQFTGIFNGAVSSSNQIATAITGAFTAPSSSFSTRLTTAETELAGTLVSSSDQIASGISGALSNTAIGALGANIVSSSNQISTPISGAFTAPSASFSTRLTTAETELAGTLISSSDQIATEITGAFAAPSASISTRLNTAETELNKTLVSSSNQIATEISGALGTNATLIRSLTAAGITGSFTAASSSFSSRLVSVEAGSTAKTLVSSSAQIATEISGAFTAPSASISTRLTTAETELAGTLISSSDQIATPISGAFAAPSASISTRLTTAETELAGTLISSSAQIADDISGSLSAASIVALGASIVSSSDQIATPISGAFVAPSSSFSTRLTTAETELAGTLVSSSAQIASDISGALSTTAIAALGGGYYSSSLQTFTNLTASGDISASGDIHADDFYVKKGKRVYFDEEETWIETDSNDRLRFVAGNQQMLLLDEDENRVNIGYGNDLAVGLGNNSSPQATLHVDGNLWISGSNGNITASGVISSSGNIHSPTSASFSTRLTTAETELAGTLVSSSDQIATPISGAFVAPSASFSTRLTTAETELAGTLVSSSDQIAAGISGALSNTAIAALGGGYYSSSLQSFTNITASGNISASGIVFASKFESAGTAGETISFNDNINLTGHLTASGDISSSGNIRSQNVYINDSIYFGNGDSDFADSSISASTEVLTLSDNTDITAWINKNDADGVGEFKIQTHTGKSTRFIVSSSGDVGIGTGAPEKKLHIKNSGLLITGSSAVETSTMAARLIVDSAESTGHTLADFRSHSGSIKLYGSGKLVASGDLDIDGKSHFEGHITASGNISASGNIITTGNVEVGGTISNVSTTNITASGVISSSGNILGTQALQILGDASFRNVKPREIATTITGEITASNSSKQITGSGTLFTTELKVGDAFKITSASVEETFTIESIVDNFSMSLDSTYSGGDVTGSHTASIDGDLFNVVTSDDQSRLKVDKSGDISLFGNISSSGVFTGSSIVLSGDIKSDDSLGSASFGRVDAATFHGDGAGITGVTAEWDGSLTGTATITGSLGMSGSITQVNGNITTDYINSEKIYLPGQGVGTMQIGSTFAVGETLDVVGNIHATSKVFASGFTTDDSTTGVVGIVSSSAQIASEISGALSKTAISTLDAGIISGSEASLNFSGSDVYLGNITASRNVSSSGEFLAPSANIINITSSQAISSSGTITGLTGSFGRLHSPEISSSGTITVATITPDTITNVNTTFVTASIVSSSTHVVTPKVIATELESTASIELDSSASITLKLSSSIGSTDGGNLYIKDGSTTQIHITGSEIMTTSDMILSSSGDISIMANGNDITLGGDGKGFLKYSHDLPGTDDVTIANIQAGDIIMSSSNGLVLDAAGGSVLFKDNAITKVTFNTTVGHITASGDVKIEGNVTASNIISHTHITASGDISSSGNLIVNQITASGNVQLGGILQDITSPASYYLDLSSNSRFNHIIAAGHITASGNISASGTGSFNEINLDDNKKIKLGTSDDLVIYHDGNHSYISDVGVGNLRLRGSNLHLQNDAGEDYLSATSNGAVSIYNDNVVKFATTAIGVNITGDVTASGNISGSAASTGSFGRLIVDGIVSGSIISGTFVGDGSGLTGASVPAGTISSSKYYNTFYVSGSDNYTSGSSSTELLGLGITGSIVPGQNNVYDLGSPTHVWRDLWLSETSLKFVSSSGRIDRFEQGDLERLKGGEPLELDAAIEGFTKLNRPEAVMSKATDKTYMDINSAGRFKFKVGDDSTTPVDLVDFRYADGGNTVAKNYVKFGQGTSDIHLSGSFLTTNANITASAVNNAGGNISASGVITGYSGSFSHVKVSRVEGGSPITFTDNIVVPNISASGIISSSTTIQGLTGSFVHFVAPTLSNVNSSTHITASGNISASGNIYAEDFYIGNEQFTDNSAVTGNFNIGASGAGSLILKHITASGNISGSAISNIETGGDISGFDLIARNDITASGNISASGNITNTGNLTTSIVTNTGISSSGNISASGNIINTGNITNLGYISTTNITASGNVSSSGNLSTAGDLTIIGKSHFTGNITASGNISASGTIFADNFQSAGGDDQMSFTDNISLTGNLTASGNISASGDITNTGNITNTGYITTTHVTASGDISASGTVQGITGSFSHLAGATSFGTVTQTTSSITFLTSSTGVITSSVTFVPNVTNTFDLGSSAKQFKDLYIDGNAYIDNIAETVAITTASFAKISSSLIPTVDNTWDLGSSGTQWKDVYIDGTGHIDIISSSNVEVLAVATTASLHTSGAYSKVILESIPTVTNAATTVVMDSSGQLFQSSNISASGFISTQTSVTASIVSASSTVTGVSSSFVHLDVLGGEITSSGNIINTGYISTTNITASGNISSSGNISALTGTGSFGRVYSTTDISASGNVLGTTGSFIYAVVPTVSASGTVTAEHFYSSDDAEIADTLTVTTIANVNTTHITASGDISASGDLYANNIILSSSEDLANTATASLSTYASYFSTGQAETANLEDGVEGQTKVLAMRSDGGNMVVTVSNAGWKTSGDGQITFDTLGDACTLQFINGHWFCIGNNGCTFA